MSDFGSEKECAALLEFVCAARGLCLPESCRARGLDALTQRISSLQMSSCDQYRDYLQVHPQEYAQLLNSLFDEKQFIVNEDCWQSLKPFLTAKVHERDRSVLRVWNIGCDAGNEAYGLAMGLSELFGVEYVASHVKIFATDLDERKLMVARQAGYNREKLNQTLDQNLLAKYFGNGEGTCFFRTDLRRAVIFGKHDVSQDPPISRMDLIVCRHVLPYLNMDTRSKVADNFALALVHGGVVLVGDNEQLPAETVLSKISSASSMYQKSSSRNKLLKPDNEAAVSSDGDRQSQLLEAAFDTAPTATVCIDAAGIVAGANACARATFGLYPQDVGRPLQDLELSYRPIELRSLIDLAYRENREVMVSRVLRPGQRQQVFDVYIKPVCNGDTRPSGMNIEFRDVTEFFGLHEQLLHLNQQLQTANEELQSAHEELETTNEELHSTNEELETTNEELQSTNEELETMNEELNSSNQELEFSNTGQRELAEAADRVNSFLESILSSMRSAVIVVDPENRVLLWNERCLELWGLRAAEVKGQSLSGLDIGLPVAGLEQRIPRGRMGEPTAEPVIIDAVNRRGQALKLGVRLISLASGSSIFVIDEETAGSKRHNN